MEKEIIIKPSFDAKSTFKATMYILGKKSYVIYFTIIFGALLINLYNADFKSNWIEWLPFPIIFPLVIIFSVYKLYSASKKQLKENPRLKEEIFYSINADYFQEKGETFEVKHFWKNLFKIVEKKEMFLIYTLKNRAMLIKKSDLKENQYNELKELFNSIDIKKSLK
jgi:hypothetical protein